MLTTRPQGAHHGAFDAQLVLIGGCVATRRKDVAARAGVSPAVVSYVLNGGPRRVARATRERVLSAIEELDYRPNVIARSLRMNRTMTLGLVIPDSSNPFFAELARAVEEAAFARGFTLLVGNATENEQRQTTYVRTFLQRQVDGILLVPAHGPVDCVAELRGADRPWLVLDRRVDHLLGVPQVLVDSRGGAREGTRHLLEHGRRAIACIAGPADVTTTKDRVAGWHEALSDAGLQPTKAMLRHAPFTQHGGYEAANELVASGRPDAVFVASDEQALGALGAFAERGLRCPNDVAVVSFDGIASSAYAVPALTTMAQPFLLLGQHSIERLTALLSGVRDDNAVSVLPVSLVRRGSCGCVDPSGDKPEQGS